MLRHATQIFNMSLRSPSLTLSYNYVRKRDIDQICSAYNGSTSTFDKIKMYTKMFAHIGKQGFKGARNDISVYRNLRAKPRSEYTSEDWNQLIRMYHDFFRLGPLLIIQILPMSGPLFILYMYTYPGSIPSWFIIDKFHEDYEKRIRLVQQQAIEYFKEKRTKPEEIDFAGMGLEEVRRLAECLYGYYRDGTTGFRKLFGREIEYFISPAVSKWLIKRKLKYKFNADLENQQKIAHLSFNQKIRWKYEQVMVHGRLLKNYQDTLTAEQLRIRRLVETEENKMEAEGGHKGMEVQANDKEKEKEKGKQQK